jgi:GNAT superfamily N-acetyltransferase
VGSIPIARSTSLGRRDAVLQRTKIRLFAAADAAKVSALVLGIQNDEFNLGLSISDQADLTDIDSYYLRSNGTFLVAENERSEIVGTIGLLRLGSDLGVMKKFFVAAPYRGKTHGIAEALYKTFLDFARSEGIRQIVLDTPSAATRSHGFYRSVGFMQIERSDLPVMYDFPERDTLFFRLMVEACVPDTLPRR